jgi:hypothetical protein
MNNLIQNYKIILKELTNTCKYITTNKQIRLQKNLIWNLWHSTSPQNICLLTLNYSYLDAFQGLIWREELKGVSTIKGKENFFLH